MAVTSFKDFDLADADREWDGDAAEKRVRKWALPSSPLPCRCAPLSSSRIAL